MRFAEYYSPFGVLAAAMVLKDIHGAHAPTPRVKWALVAALLGVIAFQGMMGAKVIERHSEYVPDKYAEIAKRIDDVAAGEPIFNAAYHDYPFLYFHRPDLKFVTGLDPHYLSYTEEGLGKNWAWIGAVKADEPNDPAPLIRKAFKTRWAVIDRHKRGLHARLQTSPHATLIHQTKWGSLFKIVLPEERAR